MKRFLNGLVLGAYCCQMVWGQILWAMENETEVDWTEINSLLSTPTRTAIRPIQDSLPHTHATTFSVDGWGESDIPLRGATYPLLCNHLVQGPVTFQQTSSVIDFAWPFVYIHAPNPSAIQKWGLASEGFDLRHASMDEMYNTFQELGYDRTKLTHLSSDFEEKNTHSLWSGYGYQIKNGHFYASPAFICSRTEKNTLHFHTLKEKGFEPDVLASYLLSKLRQGQSEEGWKLSFEFYPYNTPYQFLHALLHGTAFLPSLHPALFNHFSHAFEWSFLKQMTSPDVGQYLEGLEGLDPQTAFVTFVKRAYPVASSLVQGIKHENAAFPLCMNVSRYYKGDINPQTDFGRHMLALHWLSFKPPHEVAEKIKDFNQELLHQALAKQVTTRKEYRTATLFDHCYNLSFDSSGGAYSQDWGAVTLLFRMNPLFFNTFAPLLTTDELTTVYREALDQPLERILAQGTPPKEAFVQLLRETMPGYQDFFVPFIDALKGHDSNTIKIAHLNNDVSRRPLDTKDPFDRHLMALAWALQHVQHKIPAYLKRGYDRDMLVCALHNTLDYVFLGQAPYSLDSVLFYPAENPNLFNRWGHLLGSRTLQFIESLVGGDLEAHLQATQAQDPASAFVALIHTFYGDNPIFHLFNEAIRDIRFTDHDPRRLSNHYHGPLRDAPQDLEHLIITLMWMDWSTPQENAKLYEHEGVNADAWGPFVQRFVKEIRAEGKPYRTQGWRSVVEDWSDQAAIPGTTPNPALRSFFSKVNRTLFNQLSGELDIQALENLSQGPIDDLMQQTKGLSAKEAIAYIMEASYPQTVRDRVNKAVNDSGLRRRLAQVDPQALKTALEWPVVEGKVPLFSFQDTQGPVMGPEGKVSKGLYTICFLPGADPLNLIIGRMTGSCASVGDAGQQYTRLARQSPQAAMLAITKKKRSKTEHVADSFCCVLPHPEDPAKKAFIMNALTFNRGINPVVIGNLFEAFFSHAIFQEYTFFHGKPHASSKIHKPCVEDHDYDFTKGITNVFGHLLGSDETHPDPEQRINLQGVNFFDFQTAQKIISWHPR